MDNKKKQNRNSEKSPVKITGALNCVGVCRYVCKTIIHEPGGMLH